MGRYCSKNDALSLTTMRESEIEDVPSNIEKAETDIDTALGAMYAVPFDNITIHPKGVPPKVRWLSAELTACILHTKNYDQGEINQTDHGRNCYDRVMAQIRALVNCEAALYYTDGTEVARIGKCPEDSPGHGQTGAPISNTLGQDAIFGLNDIVDKNRVRRGGA